jgi:DNA-binding NtrC family response regulator
MEKKIKILQFEQNDNSAVVESTIQGCLDCEYKITCNTKEFLDALKTEVFDVILSDNTLPGSEVVGAFRMAKEISPHTAFILVSLMNDSSLDGGKWQNKLDMIPTTDLNKLVNTIDSAVNDVMKRWDISCHWG